MEGCKLLCNLLFEHAIDLDGFVFRQFLDIKAITVKFQLLMVKVAVLSVENVRLTSSYWQPSHTCMYLTVH